MDLGSRQPLRCTPGSPGGSEKKRPAPRLQTQIAAPTAGLHPHVRPRDDLPRHQILRRRLHRAVCKKGSGSIDRHEEGRLLLGLWDVRTLMRK